MPWPSRGSHRSCVHKRLVGFRKLSTSICFGAACVGGGLCRRQLRPEGRFSWTLSRLSARNLPVVLINASLEELPFPRVACDDAKAMELAMNHLVSLGHSKIGLVLGPRDHIPSERNCVPPRMSPSTPESSWAQTEWCVPPTHWRVVMRQRPGFTQGSLAFFALATPWLSGWFVRCARRTGYAVARLVVGFDDSSLMNCTDPPLTTVRQPIELMGAPPSTFWWVRCPEQMWCWTSCCSSPSWWFEVPPLRLLPFRSCVHEPAIPASCPKVGGNDKLLAIGRRVL